MPNCLAGPRPKGQHQDTTFVPDRILEDGDSLETSEFVIEAVHTPGHASNHLCYRHEASDWLFTGDHVIDGSTVVIDPPDGNMKQYHRVATDEFVISGAPRWRQVTER